ncbi:MAG: 4-hydroxythreonine-4-phosphate dehydrogenase PdxA [Kiritimatiellia bacterium]
MKLIAVTAGDINGIGPEVALRSLSGHKWPSNCRFVLIGNADVLSVQARRFGLPLKSKSFSVWDPYPARMKWLPGQISAAASRHAADWIRIAAEGCMEGYFDAMVTAPICKEGLKKAHLNLPGHTEYLAEITKTKRFAMMLMGGGLRVILVTRHIPLSRVAKSISKKNILESISMAAEALPWLGCRRARIGVCGLNPHAGDGGAIGTEEKTVILPAVKAAQKMGVNAVGPVAPDAIFYQALRGGYDAVVSMYHDQGLGPLKMLAMDEGINITLGLPIIRTSPDHGTAFDVAGKGIAREGSMVKAIELACSLAGKKNPWRKK